MTTPITRIEQLPPGTILRHYKGGLYTVTGQCRIEATLQTGVLYQPQQGSEQVTWMRPFPEFTDRVATPQGEVPRFTVVRQEPSPGR